MTPQERARRSAEAMWADDRASQAMGMALTAVGPGHATATMTVRDDMANGHGIAHGGYIFALADTAFAFACNSYNTLVVAQSNAVTYLTPGRVGEVLTASCTEAHRAGRSGVYDVTVAGEDGRKVALFRGHSRQVSGAHFAEDDGV
ncbi:MAG TPA: hydroxyphenylacetyl-CoA thioesterase PaaI [Rhodobacteraceae bacterium]|nr:hydroxyphenylacetyl-CoA thioesterase PaaI [Paracoccaceae bacterium]